MRVFRPTVYQHRHGNARVSCRYVRSAVLPCVEASRCLFRTRGSLPQDVVEVNEVFGMQISQSALRQKTLRVDVCNTSKSGHEECLVSGRFYIQNMKRSSDLIALSSVNFTSLIRLISLLQAGAQISLADVSCSEERCTKWYNLLSRAYMPEINNKDKESRAAGASDRVHRGGHTVTSMS